MSGYKFLFWTNGDNRVVSDDATYSFYLGDDTKLTAWFISETPDASKYYVTFRDKNNEIILAKNAAADGKIEVPTLSDYDGFTFKGWFDENGNEYTVVDGKITVEGDVTVYAKYDAKTGLKVIENGVQHENTYSYGDLVKVTAEATKEVDGATKYFSGWYANRVLVSYKTTYSFYVTGDVTIEAKYEGTEELQQKIILNMSGIRSGDETSQKLVMNVTWSLPSDCELVEAGIVRTMFSNFASYLTIEKADGTYVKRNISVLKMSAGTYIYTLTLRNAITVKEPVLARGYIIYRDAGGNLQTAYTDVNTFEFATSATTAE